MRVGMTIGQYFPGDSLLHRLDPRMKMILATGYIVMLFSVQNQLAFVIPVTLIAIAILSSKLRISLLLRSLRPVLFIIIFTGLLNAFLVQTGEVLFHVWFIQITSGGLRLALQMTLRIVCLIFASSLITFTTSPVALTDAMEDLMQPLKKIKFPVHEIAMMMNIALRFIPTLIEETAKIMAAQKARGADFETGSFKKRAKALVPILIPLFVSAFRRADELALAMEARCYNGGDGRTRMRQLAYTRLDFYAFVFEAILFVGVIAMNLWGSTNRILP